jgi:hypothetical protein
MRDLFTLSHHLCCCCFFVTLCEFFKLYIRKTRFIRMNTQLQTLHEHIYKHLVVPFDDSLSLSLRIFEQRFLCTSNDCTIAQCKYIYLSINQSPFHTSIYLAGILTVGSFFSSSSSSLEAP